MSDYREGDEVFVRGTVCDTLPPSDLLSDARVVVEIFRAQGDTGEMISTRIPVWPSNILATRERGDEEG